MAKTSCGFCQSRNAKITKEHVFGRWLGPVLSLRDNAPIAVRHEVAFDGVETARWEASSLDSQVRMACVSCNHGWMSALETRVSGIIPPMIRGAGDVPLDVEAQVAIATWSVKTAMVMEFLRPRDVKYFTEGERAALMKTAYPSSELGAHVWLACYVGDNDGARTSAARLMRKPGVPEGYGLLFSLRQFMVQVFVERRTAGHDIYVRPGPWDEGLIEIWPPRGAAIWPPRVAFAEKGAKELFSRFLALGIDSRVYGFRPLS